MNLDSIALFVHIVGLVPLFGGLMLLQRGGAMLRAADAGDDLRTWLRFLQPVRGMFAGAATLLLVTGSFMAWRQWSFSMPWIAVALVTLIAFALTGALVVGRGLTRIGRLAAEHPGPLPPAARVEVARPDLWGAISAMNGGAVGIVWLMTTKPGWMVAITVPVVLSLVGGIVGVAVARRGLALESRDPRPTPRAHGATWAGRSGA